ncbi:MAG: hypothetical protein GX085_08205 [Firmicutes bacterium]|nr:hypothetical protein [Bacillota bacterium]
MKNRVKKDNFKKIITKVIKKQRKLEENTENPASLYFYGSLCDNNDISMDLAARFP